MNETKTAADALFKIENDLFDLDYSMQKLNFLAGELCDLASPVKENDDDLKEYFYAAHKKLEMLAGLILDYTYSTQKTTNEIMRYAAKERDKYIE